MYSSTFGKGWVGMSACPLVVLACESLHVCTVCIWRCEHARFCVEVFYALYINFHSFIRVIIITIIYTERVLITCSRKEEAPVCVACNTVLTVKNIIID